MKTCLNGQKIASTDGSVFYQLLIGRHVISFCLNGVWRECSPVDPSMTLLRYLRTLEGLMGTKEGCASGDCGACTVLIGQPPGGIGRTGEDSGRDEQGSDRDEQKSEGSQHWYFNSANSCITLMSQLNGKAVLTVEALAEGEQIHPAQQVMVECHGSQCGFCTPGFVMSLAGLHHQANTGHIENEVRRHDILEALSGNLCRCTGYRPIIEAGERMLSMAEPDYADGVDIWQPPAEAHLTGSSATESDIAANEFSVCPVTEEALSRLLAQHPDARLVAGATDLALEVTQQLKSFAKTLYLGDIPTLKTITDSQDSIEIGAAVTYSQLEPLLRQQYPEFEALLKRLGSRQIRNQGTLGGNIGNASPIGDTPPVLLALDADIQLAREGGVRWLPLSKFFLGYKQTDLQPGEYIRSIRMPKLAEDEVLKVYKISKRLEDDISAVLLAVWLKLDQPSACAGSSATITDARVAFGGMAAIPSRSATVETALIGEPITVPTFATAAKAVSQDFNPLTDVRASREYRLRVAENLLLKCALELTAGNGLEGSVADLNKATRIELFAATEFAGQEQPHA